MLMPVLMSQLDEIMTQHFTVYPVCLLSHVCWRMLCRVCMCCCRFQGELFGLGNNYTKFKTKYPNQQAAAASSQYGQTYSSAPQAVQVIQLQ